MINCNSEGSNHFLTAAVMEINVQVIPKLKRFKIFLRQLGRLITLFM